MINHTTNNYAKDTEDLTYNEKLDLILRRIRLLEMASDARDRHLMITSETLGRRALLQAALAAQGLSDLREEMVELKKVLRNKEAER